MTSACPVIENEQRNATRPEPRRTMGELLVKDAPPNYFGIPHMLLSFVWLMAGIGLTLFADPSAAFPICIMLYLMAAVVEFRCRIYSPPTVLLLFLYPALYALHVTDSALAPYSVSLLFAALCALCAALLLMKKPITVFYSGGQGSFRLHSVTSNIWFGAFVLCLAAHWLLTPGMGARIAPLLICVGACALSIYLGFFDRHFVTRREKEFTMGEFTFRQIELESPEYDEFVKFYAKIAVEGLFRSDAAQTQVVEKDVRYGDLEAAADKIIFGAYRNGSIVASIGLGLDGRGNVFHFEKVFADIDFTRLRRLGPIGVMSRFGIDPAYRTSPTLVRGLVKAVVEVALERDLAFLIAEIFPSGTMFHARMGFRPLFPKTDPRYRTNYGFLGDVILLVNNIANTFFLHKDSINGTFGFMQDLNERIAERWAKRMIARYVLFPRSRRPWTHTVESVRYLLGIHAPGS